MPLTISVFIRVITVRLNLFTISSVHSDHKTHPNKFVMGYKSCSRPQGNLIPI